MPHPSHETPTILLVAEDLLTVFITDHLIAHGYAVSTLDMRRTQHGRQPPRPIDLILAEVRYPYEECLQMIGALRTMGSQTDIPIIIIGYTPTILHSTLTGRVIWLDGAAPITTILTAVRGWTVQQPATVLTMETPARHRPIKIGERHR
jgi:hypothetical protein